MRPLPPAPKGVIFAANGKLPAPLQRYRPGVLAGQGAEPPLRIMFPPNGARLELATTEAASRNRWRSRLPAGSGP